MTNIEALQEYDKLHNWLQNEAERIFSEWDPNHGYDYLKFHSWDTFNGICFKASWRGIIIYG